MPDAGGDNKTGGEAALAARVAAVAEKMAELPAGGQARLMRLLAALHILGLGEGGRRALRELGYDADRYTA